MGRFETWNSFFGRQRVPAFLALGLALTLTGGCGRQPRPRTDAVPPSTTPCLWPTAEGSAPERQGCLPLEGEALPGADIVFSLGDVVSPELAPVPHNPSERVVFAQLYETLVNVDCQGRLQPGLAQTWSCTEDSTLWVFTLRTDARFWDGTLITSQDVRRAWTVNQACPHSGRRNPIWTWFNAGSDNISLVDRHRLAIRLPEPQAQFPLLLANPATAVAVRREGWTWPVGSGPARLRASTPAPRPDLECRPNPHHPRHPIWKSLVFHQQPGSDPRDLAPHQPDLLLTGNLEAVRFYAELPPYQCRALPWNRLYLLVCPPRMNPRGTGPWTDILPRLNVSHDLTRVQARPWNHLVFPAGGTLSCPQLTGPVALVNKARRDWGLDTAGLDAHTVVFPRGDLAARELAQRLAALGNADLKVLGVHPEALDFILNWQMSGAVVLPTEQPFATRCLQTAALLGKAPWLQAAAFGSLQHGPLENLQSQGLVHPLALTRSWLVMRGPWSGLALAYDGTPLLSRMGPTAGEDPLP